MGFLRPANGTRVSPRLAAFEFWFHRDQEPYRRGQTGSKSVVTASPTVQHVLVSGSRSDSSSGPTAKPFFATTHWTVVLSAIDHASADSEARWPGFARLTGIRSTLTCADAAIRRKTRRT